MTQETRRDLRFPHLVGLVCLAAVVSAAYAWTRSTAPMTPSNATVLVVLVLAVFISEYLVVALPGGTTVSLSYPLGVAAIVYFGPSYGLLVAVASVLPSLFQKARPRTVEFMYNLGLVVLTAAIPALVFLRLGGIPLVLQGATGVAPLASQLVPLTCAATLGIPVNVGLLGLAYAMLPGRSFGAVWSQMIGGMLASQVVLGLVGIAVAQAIAMLDIWGFALFVAPLLVARQTYQRSVRLREAYADTISSLVAALEAKDAYTKGHSVRVAEYAVQIATAMGFAPKRVERVECAALLHDIGKVGVSRRVLAKEAKLTDEEYAEIKRHPGIGAHIVADVPYLADLVPFIEHHHERMDGRGYGQGMAGEDIPLEARILAVADSYDAMTSVRPYRSAMTHEDALRELGANLGTQFDEDVVAAFERSLKTVTEDVVVQRIREAAADEA